MIITGAGITSPLRVWIKPDFIPNTKLALKWAQLANGTWVAADRGASCDVYLTNITIHAVEDTIDTLIQTIYNNRIATSGTPNQLTLTNFASDEKIFGQDVVHTTNDSNGLNCTILAFGEKVQKSLHGFSLSLDLQAISPTFTGTAGPIVFNHLDIGYANDTIKTINKYDTYTSAFSYLDHRSDTSFFEGIATVRNADMVTTRRALATSRSGPIETTVLTGNKNQATNWPKNLTYLSFEEQGSWGQQYQRVKFRAVEYIS